MVLMAESTEERKRRLKETTRLSGRAEAWGKHVQEHDCCQYECGCGIPREHEHDFENEKNHFFIGWNARDAKSKDNLFIKHIESHLTKEQEVICKICGKTAKEIVFGEEQK